MTVLLPLLFVYGLFVLYGLVYLAVDSDLLAPVREWFVKSLTTPEPKLAVTVELICPIAPPTPLYIRAGRTLRRFVGRVVSCWMCTSGWAPLLAVGLTVALGLAITNELWGLVVILAVPTSSLAGIGFTTLVDHMSPKRAADRVVDAALDVTEAVLKTIEKRGLTLAPATKTEQKLAPATKTEQDKNG